MSKDELKPQICQDTSIFHRNIYKVHRSLNRKEGVHTDNKQLLTSKTTYLSLLQQDDLSHSILSRFSLLYSNNHVATSLSEDKAAAGRDRTAIITLLIPTAANGHNQQCQLSWKGMCWRHSSRKNGWENSKTTKIRKHIRCKIVR